MAWPVCRQRGGQAGGAGAGGGRESGGGEGEGPRVQIRRASRPGSFGLPSKRDGDPPEEDRAGTAFDIHVTKGDIVLLEVPSGCSGEKDTGMGTTRVEMGGRRGVT